MAIRILYALSLVLIASLASARSSAAEELLRVEGRAVKWGSPAVGSAAIGSTTVITYATLQRPFALPDTSKTLSPDNCGAMGAFDDIIAASANLTGATAREELRSAFAAWENVADLQFVEIEDIQHANIIVGAIAKPIGRAFANLSLGGGHGLPPLAKALGAASGNMTTGMGDDAQGDLATAIEQAYVCLNPRQRWKIGFDGNLAIYDLRHTLMHEIGHAIGLDHPGSSGAIMGYRYDEKVRELQPSDIAAAQLLYGRRHAINGEDASKSSP